MNDYHTIKILGSGTSTGIPILGCQCDICQSTSPKNKRFRTSIIIETKNNKTILVDTTPDFRSQALCYDVSVVDSCIITHTHADHCHGIDELRSFTFFKEKTMNIYCSSSSSRDLEKKFDYIFTPDEKYIGGGIPLLELVKVDSSKPVEIEDEKFEFFQLPHGRTSTTCFYHDGFAYLIDCHEIPQKIINFLASKELDLLILDCNNKTKVHQTHLNSIQAIDYAKKINARRTGLIHLSHDFDHQSFAEDLKNQGLSTIFPVYDGQKLQY